MLYWIVDNTNNGWLLIFLGVIGLGLFAMWWNTLKRPWLIAAGAVLTVMAACFILSLFIVTDRMRLRRHVEEMRDSYNAGKLDDTLSHFAEEVNVETTNGTEKLNRDKLKALAQMHISTYGLQGLNLQKVVISKIDVDKLERPTAEVSFLVRPEDDGVLPARCRMTFTLISGNEWRVSGFGVERAFGASGEKLPLIFPFGGGK